MHAVAQEGAFTDKSDPKAEVILKKLKSKYSSAASLQAKFALEIELEGDKEIQKGSISQMKKMYKVEMNGQNIISNGKTMWFHLKQNNEVQISNPNADEADGFLTPASLLSIYENKDFIYALIGEKQESGRTVQQIEFKPKNRDSEYAKVRLTIDKSKTEVMRIKAFSKDGSRYTLKLDQLKRNVNLKPSDFEFDPSKYPGIHIEDLRI